MRRRPAARLPPKGRGEPATMRRRADPAQVPPPATSGRASGAGRMAARCPETRATCIHPLVHGMTRGLGADGARRAASSCLSPVRNGRLGWCGRGRVHRGSGVTGSARCAFSAMIIQMLTILLLLLLIIIIIIMMRKRTYYLYYYYHYYYHYYNSVPFPVPDISVMSCCAVQGL